MEVHISNKHLGAFALLVLAVVAVLLSMVKCQSDYLQAEYNCIQSKSRVECLGSR